MRFRDILLRCLLALVLVTGGLTAPGMAGQAAPEAAPALTDTTPAMSCHDLADAGPAPLQAPSMPADCCAGADCRCDCLHPMPFVSLAMVPVAAVFQPQRLVFAHSPAPDGRMPATSLRPPIA